MQDNSRVVPFDVTANARGLTGRAGLSLVAETAKAIGMTSALSRALGTSRSWSLHDPGKVIRDVALTLADGGDALRHMAVIDRQPALFGLIASPATTCRTITAVAENAGAMDALAVARAGARERAWRLGAAPPSVAVAWGQASPEVAGIEPDEPLTVDLDATLIIAHSDDKDGAGKTYKRTWGHHPLNAYLDRGDGHGESLAGLLRPGNAGANTATDHITVFDQARAQLPELPASLPRLVRADTAGATHDFLDHVAGLDDQDWQFSVGFAITQDVRDAIRALDEADWVQATRQDGRARERAAVAEITHAEAIDLSGWPDGSRLIVRREPLHAGAQQTLDDIDGCRFTAFLTDQTHDDLARLDTRHRGHARVEDRIRTGKDTGMRTLPCDTFERNALWLQLVLLAQDLMTFTQLLTLDPGELRSAEPQQLRYKLLHTPARIIRHARGIRLDIAHDWPWAQQLVAAFERLRALPVPAG
ncbi:MAG: IS1380 family transposase [Pseudonocardiaceae bacterium]